MSDAHEHPNLAAKLCALAAAAGYVQKDKENTFHKYGYASAEAVLGKVREERARLGIAISKVEILESSTTSDGKDRYCELRLRMTLRDRDTGEEANYEGVGSGSDKGDKAPLKAQTAAKKYAWAVALDISWGDDPEADPETDRRAAERIERERLAAADAKAEAETALQAVAAPEELAVWRARFWEPLVAAFPEAGEELKRSAIALKKKNGWQ